jgi:hypothetical protein
MADVSGEPAPPFLQYDSFLRTEPSGSETPVNTPIINTQKIINKQYLSTIAAQVKQHFFTHHLNFKVHSSATLNNFTIIWWCQVYIGG